MYMYIPVYVYVDMCTIRNHSLIKTESSNYTDASIHVHTCLTDFFDLQMLY